MVIFQPFQSSIVVSFDFTVEKNDEKSTNSWWHLLSVVCMLEIVAWNRNCSHLSAAIQLACHVDV